MNKLSNHTLAFLMAVGMHLSIMGLFAIQYTETPLPVVKKQSEVPDIIHASILDENAVTAKALQLKQAQTKRQQLQQKKQDDLDEQIKQQQRQLKQAQALRKRAEQAGRQQAAKRKKAALKEQKRLQKVKQQIALEKQTQQKLKQRRLAEEQQRLVDKKQQAEAEQVVIAKRKAAAEKQAQERITAAKQQKMAEEQRQREQAKQLKIAAEKQAAADSVRADNATVAAKASADAEALIQRKVTQNWNRPSTVAGKLACSIRVNLIPSGDVMQVTITKSSGNKLFDASAERAVYKASPLPVPADPQVFTQFRSFEFIFAPN